MLLQCWCCGKPAETVKLTTRGLGFITAPHQERWRAYCKECNERVKKEQANIKAEYVKLKKAIMFETAVEKLEGQHLNIYDYKEAIEAVKEYLTDNLDKFDSSYEIMAAIIMIKERVHCKPQVQVGKYRVDFLLPEEYIVLEIDGERHKLKKGYDSVRDKAIKKELGDYWEIVRVDTDLLDKNAKNLVKAIRKIFEYRVFNNHTDIYSGDAG